MVLNIGLNVSLDNMEDWEGIGKTGKVNGMKGYITNDDTSR
jgi:hypothetical protein